MKTGGVVRTCILLFEDQYSAPAFANGQTRTLPALEDTEAGTPMPPLREPAGKSCCFANLKLREIIAAAKCRSTLSWPARRTKSSNVDCYRSLHSRTNHILNTLVLLCITGFCCSNQGGLQPVFPSPQLSAYFVYVCVCVCVYIWWLWQHICESAAVGFPLFLFSLSAFPFPLLVVLPPTK